MGLFEVFLLAFGVSMDAFAISICKGLAIKKAGFKESVICGVWFGGFQALMPLIGFFLGTRFESIITRVAPWVVFTILSVIGAGMLKEAFGEDEEADPDLSVKTMLPMAVATSIDALAVGITFVAAPVKVLAAGNAANTFFAVSIIGVITFFMAAIGVKIGNLFGSRYRSGSEVAGGSILIFIGLNSLLGSLDRSNVMGESDVVFGMLLPLAGTALGALSVYMKKGRLRSDSAVKVMSGSSAGIMVSAAVWCMLGPSMQSGISGEISVFPVFAGFWAGILIQYVLDKTVPHIHSGLGITEGPASSLKDETKIMLSEVIHHVPEGIAVGALFAGHFLGVPWISASTAMILAAAIALQNIPEAVMVALPIKDKGISNGKAVFMGMVSGAHEPILAVITVIIMVIFPAALPYVMSFAGGAIIFTVVEELIPGMSKGKDNDIGTLSFAAAFSLMMLFVFL